MKSLDAFSCAPALATKQERKCGRSSEPNSNLISCLTRDFADLIDGFDKANGKRGGGTVDKYACHIALPRYTNISNQKYPLQ
jgi:hypothetical protein